MQSVGMSSTRQSLGNAAIGGTRPIFLVSMPARPMRMRGAVQCSALEAESKRGSVVAKAAAAPANYSKRLLSTDQITTTYLSGRLRQASPRHLLLCLPLHLFRLIFLGIAAPQSYEASLRLS